MQAGCKQVVRVDLAHGRTSGAGAAWRRREGNELWFIRATAKCQGCNYVFACKLCLLFRYDAAVSPGRSVISVTNSQRKRELAVSGFGVSHIDFTYEEIDKA